LKLEVTIQPYVIFFLYCVSLLGFSDWPIDSVVNINRIFSGEAPWLCSILILPVNRDSECSRCLGCL
jgi:hypothetical protein